VKRIGMVLLIVCAGLFLGIQVVGTDGNNSPPPGVTPTSVRSTFACYPTCILPNYIVAADLDADGWLDLAVSCFGSSSVWTYANRGAVLLPGVFLTCPVPCPFNLGLLGPAALVSGTFAGIDGCSDLAVLSTITPGITGINFFPPTTPPVVIAPPVTLAPMPPLGAPVHMARGDFDHADGLSDLVVLDGGLTPRLVFVRSVGGPAVVALPAGNYTFVAVADFDQNGVDDVAVANAAPGAGSVLVYYMGLAGASVLAPLLGPNPAVLPMGVVLPTSLDTADFNNDGFPDIVAVGNASGSGFAEVFLNNVAARGFAALGGVTPTWGLDTRFVETLDADGNGWSDFVTANYASHTVTFFLTNPIGCVVPDNRSTRPVVCLPKPNKVEIEVRPIFKYELECGFYPTCIAAGDFDRNGKQDIAVTLYSATAEICPQNSSCLEVIFDVACGWQVDQSPHKYDPQVETQKCRVCKEPGCSGETPPATGADTGGDSGK